jgi:homoserine dehydrogenase
MLPGEAVESAFYMHLEVEDRPGVLAEIAEILGKHQVSVKSVVQKGLGEKARLVMVMHPVAEGSFISAVELISKLAILRSSPRTIRVIEEEFVS